MTHPREAAMTLRSRDVKLFPRRGLAQLLPFYGTVEKIRVVDKAELDGRQYALARLRWLWSSQTVALHELANPPDDQFSEILLRLRGLKGQRYDNIQKVFGMCTLGDNTFLVTSYSDKGRLLPYLRASPSLNRREFVLHVACGLEFLHSQGVVHGELCSRNIYVSGDDRAVLSGFPNSHYAPTSASQASLSYGLGTEDPQEPPEAHDSDAPHEFLVDVTQNWIQRRPVIRDEAVDDAIGVHVASDLRSTVQAEDVFALGFLMIEIFLELGPTDSQSALRLVRMARKGQRPPHPGPVAVLRGLDGLHWDACLKCWSRHPDVRIASHQLADMLRQSEHIVRPAFEWETEKLREWIDSRVPWVRDQIADTRDLRDGRDAERGLFEVEAKFNNSDGSLVPVKVVTPFIARRSTLRRRHDFLTEAFIWSQLRHPNVLPLLGTTHYEGTNNCFVVPWTIGSCVDFLHTNPGADRLKMMIEVADALHYLHTRAPTIVHGYVRARHVLVTPDGTLLLAAFDFQQLYNPETPFDDSWYDAFSARWISPEHGFTGCTTKSDVYGFAMFAYEIFSGKLPMHELPDRLGWVKDYSMLDNAGFALARGERPVRPDHAALTDEIWRLIERCWDQSPLLRPSMRTVATQLRAAMRPVPPADRDG